MPCPAASNSPWYTTEAASGVQAGPRGCLGRGWETFRHQRRRRPPTRWGNEHRTRQTSLTAPRSRTGRPHRPSARLPPRRLVSVARFVCVGAWRRVWHRVHRAEPLAVVGAFASVNVRRGPPSASLMQTRWRPEREGELSMAHFLVAAGVDGVDAAARAIAQYNATAQSAKRRRTKSLRRRTRTRSATTLAHVPPRRGALLRNRPCARGTSADCTGDKRAASSTRSEPRLRARPACVSRLAHLAPRMSV